MEEPSHSELHRIIGLYYRAQFELETKMVVRVSELKLHVGHSQRELEAGLCRLLHLREVCFVNAFTGKPDDQEKPITGPGSADHDAVQCKIIRRSIDARKKPDLFYVYTIDVKLPHPQVFVKKLRNWHVTVVDPKEYRFPYEQYYAQEPSIRPVVVGSGPAGLFCALMLARAGLCPIVLERGEDADTRTQTVRHFWESGELNTSSNVQFGEGGAGTFSDGKLNTMIKDPDGRIRFVLREFVKAGADPSILWSHKPHIGTDVLVRVVKNIRMEIIRLGGEVRFETCLTGIYRMEPFSLACETSAGRKGESQWKSGPAKVRYALELNGGAETIYAEQIVLAIGHSARDTFRMLRTSGFAMEAKAFAVGLRAEHPQSMINRSMYGTDDVKGLGAAPYKLTHKCADGRGVYSFCMCPGGYVVNASSEPGMTAVNGMSYSGRNSKNANSAIVVTVTPEDYRDFAGSYSDDPLAGIVFQQMLEKAAWECGAGRIPVQRFEDFCRNRPSAAPGSLLPENRGLWKMANLRSILPQTLNDCIMEGMQEFGQKIPGFDGPDILLSGVESRTSSPVRILRDNCCESISFPGVFPCGEGAGYAGGITSAAVDGIRVAEAVCRMKTFNKSFK